MKRTFKYRLLGNKVTMSKADTWLYLCRWLYNTALEQRILIYSQNKGQISCYSQHRQLTELKEAFPVYLDISSQTLQDVVERLDRAYSHFLRRVKNGDKRVGFPRFKGNDRYNSFTLKQHSWKINGKYFHITNIGKFKMRLSRAIEGNIKTIVVRKEHDKWYACFNCDNVPEKKLAKIDNVVGLDVGVKSFLVDSNGNKVDNPKYLIQSESLLRRRHRMLDRRRKGSGRKIDARILLTKAYEKVRNQRKDFLHKLSTKYVKDYGVLIFEDLCINGMAQNQYLAKSISDVGWGYFYGFCIYKAVEAGRQIIRISRWEPTSKTCSECGAINEKLKLSDRKWICMSCGVLHDRDYNAAKNIKRVGQTQQALTCEDTQSVACESLNHGSGECQGKNLRKWQMAGGMR